MDLTPPPCGTGYQVRSRSFGILCQVTSLSIHGFLIVLATPHRSKTHDCPGQCPLPNKRRGRKRLLSLLYTHRLRTIFNSIRDYFQALFNKLLVWSLTGIRLRARPIIRKLAVCSSIDYSSYRAGPLSQLALKQRGGLRIVRTSTVRGQAGGWLWSVTVIVQLDGVAPAAFRGAHVVAIASGLKRTEKRICLLVTSTGTERSRSACVCGGVFPRLCHIQEEPT